MHGSVQCTCCYIYITFCPLICMGWGIFGLWVKLIRWYPPFQCFNMDEISIIFQGEEIDIIIWRRLWNLCRGYMRGIMGEIDSGKQTNLVFLIGQLEVFWLPRSNIDREEKGGYISIMGVSLIDLVDKS